MIRVFAATDKDYTSNGDIVLSAIKARVHNAHNGDFYLDLQCGIEYSDYIVAGNILVVPTPQGEQAFRIQNVTKYKKRLEVKAWHVFYDTQNYLIEECTVGQPAVYYALAELNGATDIQSPFTVASDITGADYFYECVNSSYLTAIKVIMERAGGNLIRDNWSYSLNSSIGTDNGITIEYGKNLQELTAEYDWSSVCTKVLPVGKDGLTLEQVYVVSETQYDIPYSKVVEFNQDEINEELYPDHASYIDALEEDLLAKATSYLAANALPTVNYTLKANPQKVSDIGDIIQVKDERIGVNITTSVIAYEYDAIAEKYVSLEFGSFAKSLKDILGTVASSADARVNEAISTATTEMAAAITTAQNTILSTLTSGYTVFDGQKIYVVDSLPKEEAENVIKIDQTGISFSTTGISGTFVNAISISGVFNATNFTITNFLLSYLGGGILSLGNASNSNGKIEVKNASDQLIGAWDNTGLKLYNGATEYSVENLIKPYASGDTAYVTGLVCAGYCDNDSKDIHFMIQFPKNVVDVATSFSTLVLNIYTSNGVMITTPEIIGSESYTMSVNRITTNTVLVNIRYANGFSATNNTPISVLLTGMVQFS